MSAPGWYEQVFKEGGDPYGFLSESVLGLLPGYRVAAMEVGMAVGILARLGNLHPTTAEVAALLPSDRGQAEGTEPGTRCHSFIQKGFRALGPGPLTSDPSGPPGLGILGRTRRGGRRFLEWIRGLKPARAPRKPAEGGPPSGLPPEEKRDRRDTSTDSARSSSSLSPISGTGTATEAPAELVARACKLIETATPGWAAAMVRLVPDGKGVEWFARALDQVEKRNRVPGNKPVASRRYVQSTLENWSREGGPPKESAPPSTAAAPKVPTGPTIRAAAGADRVPLSAEEVAGYVEQCRGSVASLAKIARVNLRAAFEEGRVTPELVATIPPELLGRE